MKLEKAFEKERKFRRFMYARRLVYGKQAKDYREVFEKTHSRIYGKKWRDNILNLVKRIKANGYITKKNR